MLLTLLCFSLFSLALSARTIPDVFAQPRSFPRPDPTKPGSEHIRMCLWLVHVLGYGSLASNNEAGAPVGGIVSHADGTWESPTSRVFFYLTPMDEQVQNIAKSPRVSYTLTEATLPHGCKGSDPEDPACAKATLLGTMQAVPEHELGLAKAVMFSRHPAMEGWPSGHNWQLWELKVEEVHLLDWYGGMKIIQGKDYYNAKL